MTWGEGHVGTGRSAQPRGNDGKLCVGQKSVWTSLYTATYVCLL